MKNFLSQKLHELTLQVLFSFELGGEEKEIQSLLGGELKISKAQMASVYEFAKKVWNERSKIDHDIATICQNYDFSRIGGIEKSAMRWALFELFFEKNLSLEIIISEALRLTKKFSTKEGAQFVHAIIDAVVKHSLSPREG